MSLRKIFCALAALSFLCAGHASAQSYALSKKTLSAAAARKMVDACVAWAEQKKLLVVVAVVNEAGDLIELHAMDGADAVEIQTATLKAKTAARWRRPTQELYDRVKSGENEGPLWVGDYPHRGGYPIVVDGQAIGAIGTGGRGVEECGRVGVEAVVGKAPAPPR